MKCDKLQSYKGDVTIPVYGTIADADVYLKKEVDEAIAELKDVIHELQVDLEGAKATAYAESVDAGMREHRLRRALYKACANWAHHRVFVRFNASEKRWENMERKCRAMAEKFK